MKIDLENWTHCVYIDPASQDRAQISIGAEPEGSIYFISQLDTKHREQYQSEVKELAQAVEIINKRYSQWSFVDLEKPKSEKSGGCDSCQAH